MTHGRKYGYSSLPLIFVSRAWQGAKAPLRYRLRHALDTKIAPTGRTARLRRAPLPTTVFDPPAYFFIANAIALREKINGLTGDQIGCATPLGLPSGRVLRTSLVACGAVAPQQC